MKTYYLHNGSDQQGPFDIEDLKQKNIVKDTPVWYEGLSDWTTAGQIEALKDLFSKSTPPPFSAAQTAPPQVTPKKKSTVGVALQLLGIAGAIFIVTMVVRANMGDSGPGRGEATPQTYEEKVMTVEEMERSEPTKFLEADGKYNKNFWGTKIKVHGVITNTATVASYKDAIVKVTYYTKTKTELGSKEYNIYEVFPPHSEVKFELKIDNYKEVSTIGWEVIAAKANE